MNALFAKISIHNTVRILMIYGVAFLSTRMLIGGYSTIYLLSKGLSLEGISVLKGMQSGIMLLFSIPFSYLSDKYSRRKIINLAFLFSAIWLGLTAYAPNPSWIYIGEIFNALSLALYNEPFEALLISSFKRHHPCRNISEVLGVFSKYSFIFMAIAVIVGGFSPSIESSFFWWVASGILVALYISSLFLLKRIDFQNDSIGIKKLLSRTMFLSHLKDVTKIIIDSRMFMIPLLFLSIVVNLYYQIILQYWQPISSQFLTNSKTAAYYSAIFIVILLAQAASGKSVSKIRSVKKILYILIALVALASAGIAGSQKSENVTTGLLFIALTFFLIKLLQITISSRINQLLPEEQRATFISSASTAMRLFLFPLFFIVGALVSVIGLKCIPIIGFSLIFTIPLLIKMNGKMETVKV